MFELEIFKWIETQVVEKILSYAPIEKFVKWDIIFKEWELTNWKAYVINSWEVEVTMKWKSVATLVKWEIFWEIALLSEEERNATVTATTNLELIIVTYSDLIEMINHDDNIINKQIMRRIEQNIKLLG
jgi:CRP-like cAMP-binding protein